MLIDHISRYSLVLSETIDGVAIHITKTDVLNIIAIHDNKLKESFMMLSPRNLIIDNQGILDRRFSFIKEQNLGIWQLNNI